MRGVESLPAERAEGQKKVLSPLNESANFESTEQNLFLNICPAKLTTKD